MSEDEPPEPRSKSAKRALTMAEERLPHSTYQKNPVIMDGYNPYMTHHYVYLTKVVEIREPESYVEVAQDAH